jgi:hypothetical protein
MMNFDAEAIPGLLKALDAELEQRGVTADIYLVEGAAMARETLGPSYPIPPRAQYLLTEIFEDSVDQES